MDEDVHNRAQPQVLNRTKAGKALEEQARELEKKRSARQQEFASGRKRYTEGK